MNVELAKTAGFCFGVKRAVDTVYQQIEQYRGEKIFTYGPIIHNEEVIKDLRSHGVEVLNDEEELKTADADVVVIRSHGVAKYIYDILEERGITCVDATCPFVKKIHKIVAEKSAEEYKSMELLTDYLQKLYRRSDLSEQYVAEWLNQCKLLSIDASKKSTKKIKGKRYLCIPISSLNLGSL